MHKANKELQLEQYTNSGKTSWKVYKIILHVAKNTQTRESPKLDLKRGTYANFKLGMAKL